MLNKETRDEINAGIEEIRYWENKVDDNWVHTMDKVNTSKDRLLILLNMIWINNHDKTIQSSVNYYRRKAGLKTWKVTAQL